MSQGKLDQASLGIPNVPAVARLDSHVVDAGVAPLHQAWSKERMGTEKPWYGLRTLLPPYVYIFLARINEM